jgi:hypothetical protein
MEEKDKKEECCESSKGGCGCGKGCCAGKAAFALVLLVIGGLIGFAVGRGGLCHRMMPPCPMAMGMPGGAPTK